MIDLFLKADSEAQMIDALLAAGLIDKEGNAAEDVAVDVIGQIVRIVDDKPQALDGWHVNVRLAEITDKQLNALITVQQVQPANPFRVFA